MDRRESVSVLSKQVSLMKQQETVPVPEEGHKWDNGWHLESRGRHLHYCCCCYCWTFVLMRDSQGEEREEGIRCPTTSLLFFPDHVLHDLVLS